MDAFTSQCEVFSTTCGHIFHNNCLNTWLGRGEETCPSCRHLCYHQNSSTPNTHKVFLHFEGEFDGRRSQLETEIATLKRQLVAARAQARIGDLDADEELQIELDMSREESLKLMDENEILHKLLELNEADIKEKQSIIYAMNDVLEEVEQTNRANPSRPVVRSTSNISSVSDGITFPFQFETESSIVSIID